MSEHNPEQSIRAGVLGATGMVGQRFVEILSSHPWFDLTEVAASEASAGKEYRKAAAWQISPQMPRKTQDLVVKECKPDLKCDVIFSSLPGDLAGPLEEEFAEAGYPVFSNAKSHRMDRLTPLLIPEVNPSHLELIDRQQESHGWREGFIAANPNCSAVGLTLALLPLVRSFGVNQVIVTTLQAVSGAGYPGESSMDMIGNVVPYIGGEEEKLVTEPRKLLGELSTDGDKIQSHHMKISPQCTRVPVVDGHTETVSVTLESSPSLEDVRKAIEDFQPEIATLNLPSAPEKAVQLIPGENRPQPRLDRTRGEGMTVSLGRLRPCEILDYKFVLLSHNTLRGAASGSILNAELAASKGLIKGSS